MGCRPLVTSRPRVLSPGHWPRCYIRPRTTSTRHHTISAKPIVKVRLSSSHSTDTHDTLSAPRCTLAAVADYVSAGNRPVIVKARAGWTTGELVSWWRRPSGWVGKVNWRTGAPIYSTARDILPAAVIVDGRARAEYVVLRARHIDAWLAQMALTST